MKQCGLRRKWLNEECEGQRNQGEGGQELWDGHSMCSSALEENKRVNEGQALGWQVASDGLELAGCRRYSLGAARKYSGCEERYYIAST